MGLPCNQVFLQGRINRIDLRKGLSKAGAEFISVTFTLDIEGNQIQTECFSMKLKKSGDVLSSYQGLITLFEDAKCLHKTVKEINSDQPTVIEDETIVNDIDECDALDCGNFRIKYCRFEENAYAKDGELVKNIRIQSTYPRRVDEDKKEYTPRRDWEICGLVKLAPVMLEKDEEEFMQFKVIVPTYKEGYNDVPDSITLNEITIVSHDSSVFGYLEDNFTNGAIVCLNGEIIRDVQRVEIEAVDVDENRGFGRTMKREPQYRTKVNSYYEVLGGYPLEDYELEEMREFNQELWQVAKELKETKEQEMLNGGERPKAKVGFGKEEKPKTKTNRLPF